MSDLGAARGRIVIDVSDVRRAQQEVQQASKAMTRALEAIGVGFSAVQIIRFAVDAEKLAVAYERQLVAAQNLAGSQAKLNDLLSAYDRATGGAIDKAQALADVTRLQAIGFADSAAELERFATAARGISIATGQSLDYVIGQLQLAIANKSTLRLDQLGLGVAEVKQRIDELKASNSDLTEEQIYQNAILELAEKKFGALTRSAVSQRTGVEDLTKAWKDFQLVIGQLGGGPIDFIAEAMANWLKDTAHHLQVTTDFLFEFGQVLGLINRQIPLLQTQRFIASSVGRDEGRHAGLHRRHGALAPATPRFNDEQIAAQLDFVRERNAINRDANRQLLDAERDYGRQRAETIRQYETTILRDAEDFALARQRQQRDFNRNIQQLISDGAERDAQARIDLDERLAEGRQQSNERIARLEADFAKSRERAQEDHRDKLLSAAGRLDAIALLEERKRFARQSRDAKEDFDERLDEERNSLQKRLDQDQRGFERSLEAARRADERRLQDMHAALELQRADEDEDRRIAADRRAADHQAQLDEMAIAQGERLQQIRDQQAEQLTALQDAFEDELLALGLHNVAIEAERKRARDAELKEIEPFMRNWFGSVRAAMDATFPNHPSNADIYLNRTVPIPQRTPTGGWGTGSSSGVTIGTLAPTIVLGDLGGRTDAQIKALVYEGIVEAMEAVAG